MRVRLGSVILVALAVLCCGAVKPSSKVDFTEADDLNDGFVSVFKNYPKIQVTVDTSKLKRVPLTESEDSSGSSGSSGSESVEKPTVGVRTDITIEISEESANDTANAAAGKVDLGKKDGSEGKKGSKSEDDDNASVPVFKGMAGIPTISKPTKPSSTNGVNGHIPIITLNKRPPSFVHKTEDRRPSRPYDGWNRFHPVAEIWTTERPYIHRLEYDYRGYPIYMKEYDPYGSSHHRESHQGFKPCYCSVYQPWDRAPSNPVLPTPTPRKKVDDKVDIPYKQHRD
ncbi:uncharacterized protein LOC129777405 [Toxorhynchites rutilus septentrionalis]|uniref:uncharacterized protein LOC129777405 n=1 Tax=Toxorhynchites rutilus septentrionalis TaxID=329112 RepID=UPI00247ADDE7|nr:uncharacterized protein LOC129777405 [Toxorhynchites rutilus septentrionalis]